MANVWLNLSLPESGWLMFALDIRFVLFRPTRNRQMANVWLDLSLPESGWLMFAPDVRFPAQWLITGRFVKLGRDARSHLIYM